MKRDLLHKAGRIVLAGMLIIFLQPFVGAGLAMGQSNSPDQQIRFTPAMEAQAILDNLKIQFDPEELRQNGYPPDWDVPYYFETVHGIAVFPEANPRINNIPIAPNDYIGGFYHDSNGDLKCGGLTYWPGGTMGIVFGVYGDNPNTPEKDGFAPNEVITFKLFSWENMKEYLVDVIGFQVSTNYPSKDKWAPLGLSKVVNMQALESIDFYISSSANPVCEGNQIVLQGNEFIGSGGPYTFNWSSDPPGFNYTTQFPPATTPLQTTTYHLTVNDGGLQSNHDLTVLVNSDPVVNAGNNASVCANAILPLNGTSVNTTATLWTTSGDGTFVKNSALITTYTPGVLDNVNGQAVLTLTGLPLNPCDDVASDNLVATILRLPIVNAGTDKTVCTNENVILQASAQYHGSLLWTTSGSGTFSSPTSTTTQYFGTANDFQNGVTLTLCSQAVNPCVANICDAMHVTYAPGPTVSAPSSKTSCENVPVSLTGSATNYSSILWTTAGDGTFSSPTTFVTTYSPGPQDCNNAGVIVTLNAYALGNCASATKNVTINLIQLPKIISFGNNGNMCITDAFMQLNATIQNYGAINWTTSGDGTFNTKITANPKYYPGVLDRQTKSFKLTLTLSPLPFCATSTADSLAVTIQNNPVAGAGADATICAGQTITLSDASGTSYSGVLWSTSGSGTFSNPAILKPIYTPSTADANNSPVTLTLTTAPISPCAVSSSDNRVLTIIKTAVANAGTDAAICETNTYTLNGTVNYSPGFIWTTSGDGTFNNASISKPVYTPGSADKNAGNVSLTLTAQQNSPCVGSVADAMQLTIQPSVAASAGTNATICETANHPLSTASASNYASLLWSTNGDGTFNNATTLKPTYTPGVADKNSGGVVLTLVATAISPCSVPKTSTKTLTIIRNATANAGSDAQICETNTYTLSGAVTYTNSFIWTTSGDGTFNNANSLSPIYTPGNSDKTTGLVTLTITAQQNAPCVGTPTDAMQLTIQRDVVANAGTNATICETANHPLSTASASNYNSLLWTTNGDGTFSSTTILKPTYAPGTADKNNGSVLLTLTATSISPCSLPKTSSKMLTIIRNATAGAGSDATICETNTYTPSGTVTYTNSFIWTTSGDGTFNNANSLSPIYTPGNSDKTTGLVTLTITAQQNAPCSGTPTDAMTLTIQRDVVANAGTNATICETANHALLTASASNYASLLWSTNGDGTFSSTTTLKPTYTPGVADKNTGSVVLTLKATAISPCSFPKTSTKTLTIIRNATASAGNDATICETNTYTLSGAVNYSNSFVWTTSGDGTFSNANSKTPIYTPGNNDKTTGLVTLTITAQQNAPCAGTPTDAMQLTIQPDVLVNAGTPATICETTTHPLTSASASNYNSLLWTTNGDGTFSSSTILNPTYTPGVADKNSGSVVLTLKATAISPCSLPKTSTKTLTIQPDVAATAGTNAIICETETHTLSNASASNYASLLWSTSGDGTFSSKTILKPIYTPGAADKNNGTVVLTLKAFAISPCSAPKTSTKTLTIKRNAIANAGLDAAICETSTYTLSGSVINSSVYAWATTGDGTFSNANIQNPVYTPGANDKASGNVTLTLTAQQNAPCLGTTIDAMQLTIQRDVAANAGTNAIICETETHTLSNASASNYTSLLWSTNGDGTFSSNTILKPIYTPGAADKNNGTVVLTLKAFAISPCSAPKTSTKTLTIKRNAIANAGLDAAICETSTYTLSGSVINSSVYAWATTGDGTFSNANIQNPVYTPGANDKASGNVTLTLTAQQNAPCLGTTIDAMQLTIQRDVAANAGTNAIICETETHTLSNASASNYTSLLWSTNGDGTFSSTTALKPVYTPGVADKNTGSVVLTLKATALSPCILPITSTKTLTIIRNATANAGTNATICETGVHLLSSASATNYTSLLWSTSGDGTFSSTTALKPVYTPGVADKNTGSVVLTLKATALSPCILPKTSTKTLTIIRAVTANAGNDVTVCTGGGQLSGSAQHYTTVSWTTSGDGTFNNISSLSPVYTPGPQDIAARQATLTMAAGSISPCTSMAIDQVKMIIDIPQITSSSVNDQLLKTGNILVFTFNVASAQAGQYTWYANGNVIPGQTDPIMIMFNVMPANAGQYQAVFNNNCGIVVSQVATVTVLQPYAQQLTIPKGWSGISSFVTPLNPALESVFSPVTNDMILMANNSGIFWPGQNINTLGNLETTEGYKIKMQNSAQVSVSGNVSYPLSALTIPAGWSYLPVNTPCEENVDQFAAYPQIAMIKDIAGTGIYWPEMGINTIGNLIPGKAYFILNNSTPFVMKYQGCNGFKTSMLMPAPAVVSPWPMVAATPITHVFGFTREALAEFTDGDIIGAFDAKGNCMGVMQVDKMQYTNSLVVFGADNTDEFTNGMDVGELVKFRSLRQLENVVAELEVSFASRNASDGYFMENGISVVDHAAACATGIENHTSIDAAQIKVYPNPTRGELTIALGNISLRDASVVITNQNGQMMLRRDLLEANTQLNLENLPRGIYHLRITTGSFVKVERIILN